MKTTLASLCALLLTVTGGFAADKGPSVNATDEKFIKETAADGVAEVKIAELASKKAERAEVKEYAEMLVKDHTAANKELEGVAKNKGVDVSAIIDPASAKDFQSLEKTSGSDFDTQFLKLMESNHKKCISSFESEQKNGKDGELKDFVNKTLPTLKTHYDKAQSLRK